ncbi:MAG: hypothetical protein RLZZ60_409 [Bacteroidota bacterium]
MTLSELKNQLQKQTSIVLHLPDQSTIPAHFHVTEVGQVQKQFVDCGGTFRTLNTIRIQLWVSSDVEHRLSPSKWLGIMEKAEQELGLKDVEIEVEYQATTIQVYRLSVQGDQLILLNTHTECLAPDLCGINAEKKKVNLVDLTPTEKQNTTCKPGGNCC